MWSDQYDRMKRGLQKIENIYSVQYDYEVYLGRGEFQQVRDDVVHFFQDCFHLRDWILYDTSVSLTAVEKEEIRNFFHQGSISAKAHLPICRDVANAAKHLTLDNRALNRNTVMGASGTIHVVGPIAPGGQTTLKFFIENAGVGGTNIDALNLARECVREWDEGLRAKGLLT